MTSADTDFVRLNLSLGTHNLSLKKLGLNWPPPERLYLDAHDGVREAVEGDDPEFVLERISMSELPYEAVADPKSCLARGAQYAYPPKEPPC